MIDLPNMLCVNCGQECKRHNSTGRSHDPNDWACVDAIGHAHDILRFTPESVVTAEARERRLIVRAELQVRSLRAARQSLLWDEGVRAVLDQGFITSSEANSVLATNPFREIVAAGHQALAALDEHIAADAEYVKTVGKALACTH